MPMRWLAFNGSPRGRKSNTHIMLERIREGMEKEAARGPLSARVDWDELLLNRVKKHEELLDRIAEADGIIFAYPLYTDSMPGIALQFLQALCARRECAEAEHERTEAERVEGSAAKRLTHCPPALFLVHSGFPEGVHTAHLPEVHAHICSRTGLQYAGTVRKPGSEGVRLMPAFMLRSLFRTLRDVGAELVAAGRDSGAPAGPRPAGTRADSAGTGLRPRIERRTAALVRCERMGPFRRATLRVAAKLGVVNLYWIRMLKEHGGWKERFDAPYGPSFRR